MSIEVANESGVEVDEAELIDVAAFVIARMDVHPAAELSITLVDKDTMADLHVTWMNLPEPGPAMLGDIVLCPAFAADQAASSGHPLAHELALLTVHGCLHLLGYDHAEPAEEREMFGLQNELLGEWYDHRDESPRVDA